MDFNNDGHRDFLLLNGYWYSNRNDLYWNDGDGTFERADAGDLTNRSAVRTW